MKEDYYEPIDVRAMYNLLTVPQKKRARSQTPTVLILKPIDSNKFKHSENSSFMKIK